ncbi:MAG: DUF790 family protein [Nitrososphaerota archaeon]|nr:DUF790 family protein [Nitrososphaerota archaeon]
MLPSNLLRAKISRGKINPLYVGLDADTLALAERVTGVYRDSVGKRKGELIDRLAEAEGEGYDFKLVRGLAALLERRCVFKAEGAVDPMQARMAVFEEASRKRVTSVEERGEVVRTVAAKLGIPEEALERTIYSDLDEELVLKDFQPLDSGLLLRRYNLSLTQTLLFKSLRVEFSASGNWKNIFRGVKRFGLIYSVEKGDNGGDGRGGYTVSLDGPLSLFKLTDRYGTSVAKLLPMIAASDTWRIKAEILSRSRGNRVYIFETESGELKGKIDTSDDWGGPTTKLYDSSVEERFAKSFASYGSGWSVKREPEPLIAGRHVLIPDFGFEKDGAKVYLEVVGFWTPGYLERKLDKLESVAGVDMIIAVDESLACAKVERLRRKAVVVYYKKEVPVKPVIEHLKEREASILRVQAGAIRKEDIVLDEDVVSLSEIAKEKGVSLESLRLALAGFDADGYVRAGDLFVSKAKLGEIDAKLAGVEMLVDALRIIGASGVREEHRQKVLDALGYVSIWTGMEVEKVRISKRRAEASEGTA